jgi:hypothetical protein
MAIYAVQNQWGGDGAPWHDGGKWALGSRDGEQYVVALNLFSQSDDYTLEGTLLYSGEPYPIAVIATQNTEGGETSYDIQTQTENEDWALVGSWIIGSRPGQPVVQLEIASNDEGATLEGTMTYLDEGPIGFYAVTI